MRRWIYYLVCCIIVLGAPNPLVAQDLTIKRATGPIKIDGVLDDEAWQNADVADNFRQYFPFDTSAAMAQTEARMVYDDNYLYISGKLWNLGPRNYVVPSLRRDFRGEAFDGFTVILDTYKDKTNAFVFGVNPYGVQREGLIANGGNFTRGSSSNSGSGAFSLNWDNKWFSEAKIYEDHWTVEMAIPFKTLRFKEGMDSWYINFYRIDSEYAERSTWSPIPRNFSIINIGFNKEAMWDEPVRSPGKNVSLIPYVSYRTSKNYEESTPVSNQFLAGGDAKVALSSALNLDLTINPDFSQVETDQQVTNLDRFEIFFPEQRQFFLENADLFAQFGSTGTRPFFSRRIGVARDESTGTNVENPLYAGARLSGNLNNKTRIGVLSVQAAEDSEIELPSTNYTAIALQRRIGPRSNISALFVNKQAFQDTPGGDFDLSPFNYNRTAALDANLATPDNRWSGKAYYHHSFDQDQLDSAFSWGVGAQYQTLDWEARADFRQVGANFNPEVGFVRRTDISRFNGTIYRNFYPSSGPIQSHAPGFNWDLIWNETYGTTDWDANLLYRFRFRNTSRLSFRLRREYVYLFDSFDPTGTDGPELPAGTDYAYNLIFLSYNSDQRKSFFYDFSTRIGQYFNGHRTSISGAMGYRFSQLGNISMDISYNHIRMPEGLNDADLILVGPRIDLTFTRNIFWTTFIQYNDQIDNVNINTRLQWRYQPVSDIFIVYTDNYLAEDNTNRIVDFSQPKARALVFKMTYWFNL